MNTRTVTELAPHETNTPIRILILDDQIPEMELVLIELRDAGLEFEHTLASNKDQFLRAIRAEKFDAILADFRLPEWTGLDALKEVQKIGQDIPFLLVTGTLGEEAAVECIKNGISDYILKDHIARLPEALKRALREKEMRLEAMRAAKALERSEALARQQLAELDMVYRSAPVCLEVLDRNLRYIRVNDAIARNHGIPAADFAGRSLEEMIPESAEEAGALFRQVLAAGTPNLNLEVRVKRRIPPYEARDYLASFYPLFAADGEITAACAVMVDITDRKKAQEALRLTELRNRDLVENTVYGICRVSAHGQILDANPAMLRILGCASAEDLKIFQKIRDVFRFPEQHADLFASCQRKGVVHGAETEWRRLDGGIIAVRLNLRLLNLSPDASEVEIIAEDVTQLRAMERQLRQAQKFEAIGQLAGGIAHDFNNVVGAILGWAELGYEQNKTNLQTAERFTRIREQAERAAALTRELLTFARRQVLQPRPVDLNNVTSGLMTFLDKVIGKDIELKVVTHPLEAVKADPTQIEQVLMNLCINARDAMPEGGRLLIETEMVELDESYCRFYPGVAPGGYAVLSVSDTGIGMDSETRERIFEPFFTTKEVGKGTGMGLATVYGIIKQHGGFIHVYSEPGQGTLFRTYLPAMVEVTQEKRGSTNAAPSLPDMRGTETILIAEDHESIREMARQTLVGLGYRVLCAEDGELALTLCQNESPSLAVLDVIMPRLGGVAVSAKLEQQFPGMPILFTSGYSQDPVSDQGLAENQRFLQKPYSPTTLGRLVREILDGKRQAGAGAA
ncbi:MAG TPA: response regulator [Candidatus Acidoferrum sp.]|nr:response regulator [Candidatus Acidoferrum sp.]